MCTPSQKAEVAESRPSWRVVGVYTLIGGQLLAPHTRAKWIRWSTGLTTCTQATPVRTLWEPYEKPVGTLLGTVMTLTHIDQAFDYTAGAASMSHTLCMRNDVLLSQLADICAETFSSEPEKC